MSGANIITNLGGVNFDMGWWGPNGPNDPVWSRCSHHPLWHRLQEEQKQIASAEYLGIEPQDISDDNIEAYREGYIFALFDVGRMIYAVEQEAMKSGEAPHGHPAPAEPMPVDSLNDGFITTRGGVNIDMSFWRNKHEDPVHQRCRQNPLWAMLQKEQMTMAQASVTRFPTDPWDISENKIEAFREGYITALSEVGRMIYSLERQTLESGQKLTVGV